MAGLTPARLFCGNEDRPSIGSPFVSHPRHTMPDNRKHRRSDPDVDRNRMREHTVEITPFGAWRDALDSKVVAVGEGPADGARLPRFSRSLSGSGP